MNDMKYYILLGILFLSKISMSQNSDNLALSRTDFKPISSNNTVSITSYVKDGKHLIYAGGFGDVDIYSLNKKGKLTHVGNQELYKKKGPARGMVADNIKGTDFLFIAN